MTTQNEILTIVYQIVKGSPINDLTGGIFKRTRPTDSKLEDCVINVIMGTSAKFLQDGGLFVKIFYEDLVNNNTYFEDTANGQVLEMLLYNLSVTLLKNNVLSFDIQSRELYTEAVIDTNAVKNIHQHYAILKINFKNTMS